MPGDFDEAAHFEDDMQTIGTAEEKQFEGDLSDSEDFAPEAIVGGKDEGWVVEPIGNRILVKVEQREEMTRGGLYIPQTAREEKATTGTVIAIARDAVLDDEEYTPAFKVGDFVLFGKWVGMEIGIGREKVLILREADIMAVLRPVSEASRYNRPGVKDKSRG